MKSGILIKRLLASFIFLLGLALILRGGSMIFVPKNNSEAAGMDQINANGILAEKENTVDILIIGDSESQAGISPPQLWRDYGYTAYITGTIGQTLIEANAFLDKALKTQHPKVIILETGMFFQYGIRQTIDLVISQAFPIFRYHNRWKSLNRSDFTNQPMYTHIEKTKGWRPSEIIAPASTENHMLPSSEREPLPFQSPYWIQIIKRKCDAVGAQLILVRMPNTTTWTTPRHNTISDLSETLHCPFLDMNMCLKEMQFDFNTDTRDGGDHVNNAGTAKTTKYLGDYLTQLSLLKDHRNDPAYDDWDQSILQMP